MINRILVTTLLLALAAPTVDAETYGPNDPIASISGEPIFLGELNLILVQRLGLKKLDNAPIELQQAAALMLVRQHLAMRALRKQGGESLEAMINQKIESVASDAKRRGSSLEEQAKQLKADDRSLRADLAWRVAWGQYLKSRLTEKTLRSFFNRERNKYAGGRWNVSQIFLKMNAQDETSVGVAESRMNDIIAGLKSASDLELAFASAAQEHSEGGTADDGGKIGWVEGTGDLPTAVFSAIRKSKPDTVIGPVRSPLGLHLVMIHDYQQKDLAFEDLTDQAQLRRDAADALFNLLLKQQKDAKITWYIGALKPPANVSVIPE